LDGTDVLEQGREAHFVVEDSAGHLTRARKGGAGNIHYAASARSARTASQTLAPEAHHLAVGKGLTLLAAQHDRNQRAGCDCCRRERARVAQERPEVCHVL